jgi:hypothetical protein
MVVHLIANPRARKPFLGVNRFDPVAPGGLSMIPRSPSGKLGTGIDST